MDDGKLIDLFFERSEQAIAELSRKYGNLCNRIAQNILNNRQDSEECVNDAYLAVWNTVPPQRPEPLAGYLSRIVKNLALKKYHENTAQKRNSTYDIALDEIADCFPSSASVEDELEAKETAKLIDRFLETLPEADRIMFVRRYWYADTTEDIANMFGKTGHYVSVRLSRVRKSLRKYLIREGVDL